MHNVLASMPAGSVILKLENGTLKYAEVLISMAAAGFLAEAAGQVSV